MMKITKGLENIHSVIDRHEAEWRKEQGEPVEELNPITLEETVRRRLTAHTENSKGKFSADRFLGVPSKKKTPVINPEEPETKSEKNEIPSEKSDGGVEVVSVIKQDEGKNHSWLYNEVLKAVNNAAGTDKNVKVVAVFVPVVQNGKEFENLPVDNFVTTQPVKEEEVKFEAQDLLKDSEPVREEDFNLLPEGQDEPDAELADAFQTMEEKLDETLQEQENETETEEAPEEPEILKHENIETLHLANKVKEPEPVIENEAENFESLVEAEEPEITEEISSEEQQQETEMDNEPEAPEEIKEGEAEEEVEEEIGETEEAEELPIPPLPDELDDDEVYDETNFSDPVQAIQMIEGDEENSDSENSLEIIETDTEDDGIKLTD